MTENTVRKDTRTYVEDLSFVVERTIDAPIELAWEAWTKPEHVAKWWGMVPLHVCEIDLRVGGAYRFVQKGQDGNEVPFIGVYREIAKPELLVYTQIFDVEPYNIHEAVCRDTFTSLPDGKTRLSSRTTFPNAESLQGSLSFGMEEGAVASLERFAAHLESMR